MFLLVLCWETAEYIFRPKFNVAARILSILCRIQLWGVTQFPRLQETWKNKNMVMCHASSSKKHYFWYPCFPVFMDEMLQELEISTYLLLFTDTGQN